MGRINDREEAKTGRLQARQLQRFSAQMNSCLSFQSVRRASGAKIQASLEMVTFALMECKEFFSAITLGPEPGYREIKHIGIRSRVMKTDIRI